MPTEKRSWTTRPQAQTLLLAALAAGTLTLAGCGEDEPAGVP